MQESDMTFLSFSHIFYSFNLLFFTLFAFISYCGGKVLNSLLGLRPSYFLFRNSFYYYYYYHYHFYKKLFFSVEKLS